MRVALRPILATALLAISWLGMDAVASRAYAVGNSPARMLQLSRDAITGYASFESELRPVERRLFLDARDGRLDRYTLFAAALVAGGTREPREIAEAESRYKTIVAQLRQDGVVAGTPREQARTVFEFLHTRVLTGGYRLDCSNPAITLNQGRFNCISASVLFNCLAGEFGLTTQGLEIPGHAMSRLILDSESLDIEATCANWFDFVDDPAHRDSILRRALSLSPGEPVETGFRAVTPIEQVAMVYYNRGVDFLAREEFAEAASANAKALRLDPSSITARGNLLATINNWAIALSAEGQYAGAIELLDRGTAIDPNYVTFASNYVHVHNQWATQLCEEERYRDALRNVDEALRGASDTYGFEQVRLSVYRRWTRHWLETGRCADAMIVLDEARAVCGDCPDLVRMESEEVNRHASRLAAREQYQAAIELLDGALAHSSDSSVLRDNRVAAVMRWAQPAFESQDYAEAIRRTTFGANPGVIPSALRNNVRYGYHRWISGLLDEDRLAEARRIARQAGVDPFLKGHLEGVVPSVVWN